MHPLHPVIVRRPQHRGDTAELEAFPRRQALWVILNCGATVGLLFLHFAFAPFHGLKSPTVVYLLIGGAVVEAADAVWLLKRKPPLWLGRIHVWALTWFTLLLAFLLSMASPVGDIQFSLMMLLPVVAISFRRSPWPGLCVGAMAGVLTLFPPGLYLMESRPVQLATLFDACVLAMLDIIVALVVWLLSSALRREADRLKHNLIVLEETRARLVMHEKLAIVGEFASSIAHEIRNPVAMISSSLDIAARDDSPEALRAEMSRIARDEAARLANLTGDFLVYARNKPPELQPVVIAGMLGYVAGLVRARATEVGVDLKVECPSGLTHEIDEFQIHRALLNLVANAIDALSAGGGVIVIGARPAAQGAIELFVQNTGPAIPPDDVERIFDPFFTSRNQGTGLGLPIARSIALGHGGELGLSENTEGRVTFTLRIPSASQLIPGNGEVNVTDPHRR